MLACWRGRTRISSDGGVLLRQWTPAASQLNQPRLGVKEHAGTSVWWAYAFVYDVFIASADGTGWTGLTDDIFDHVDDVRPSWSPDSAKLAVAITQTTGVDQYITQLGVMNTSRGRQRRQCA